MSRLHRRWVQAGDHRLHLRTGGPPSPARPPVLLVPGLAMSSRYLVPTGRALAADRRVVAPDLPGSGHSPHAERPLTIVQLADILADILASTIGPAVVVANSFGCQLAVELALRHPSTVRRLVLTGPVLAPPARSLPAVARRFVAAMRHEPWSYLGIVVLDNLRGWTRKGRANLRALLAYPIEERVRELTVPALVVRGEQDRLVPEAFARRLADLVPDGRYVEVPAPHALTYDGPRTLARLVRDGDAAASRD